MKLYYAAIAASLLIAPLNAQVRSLEHAVEIIEHLDALNDAGTLDTNAHGVLEALNALKQYVMEDDSLTTEQQEILLEKIADFDSEKDAVTRKGCKSKIYDCLGVTRQLVAKKVTVNGPLNLQNAACNAATLEPCTTTNNYTLVLPCDVGLSGQVLSTDGNNPSQLYWQTVSGSSTSTVLSGTICDIPLTLVLRDSNGSFEATTITLSGNSLINFSTLGGCDTGAGFVFAPTLNNTIIGINAGNNNLLSGQANTALGAGALQNITNASRNVAVGYQAMNSVTSGFGSANNTAVGYQAFALGTGSNNTAVGYQALQNSASAVFCNAFGYQALQNNSTGYQNTAIGDASLNSNTIGINNVGVGRNTLSAVISGQDNTALGWSADVSDSNAQNRTAIGSESFAIVDNGVVLGNTFVTTIYPGANKSADLGYIDPANIDTRIWSTIHTVTERFYDSTNPVNFNASFSTPSQLNNSYDMLLPVNQGSAFQVLSTDGNNPAQLSWITTVTSTLLNNATPCDIASELVLRDNSGSFEATTITLTGNSLINYSTIGGCNTGNGFIFAPTLNNTIIGTSAGGINLSAISDNTALGFNALTQNTNDRNTAVGSQALAFNTTGSGNIALGYQAGVNATTGNNNIYIGANVVGNAGDANFIQIGLEGTQQKTVIAGIRGTTTDVVDAVAVLIDSAGQLGTVSSSERYKENIQNMDGATTDIYQLRPVTFNYKTAKTQRTEYGLIAEEVENIYPGIVVKNEDGLPETVQYQYLPVMMLNEQIKDHAKILMHEETITVLKNQIAELQEQIAKLVR